MKQLLLCLCVLAQVGMEAQKLQYQPYVNPMIGTGGHGHTFPGATLPFGMIQMSPDTRLDGWDGCSGYHYDDNLIYGFSQTHLSGTGVSDYGDVLLMPGFAGTSSLLPSEFKSNFTHQNERAQAGVYEVLLDKFNIKAELAASTRSGIYRFSSAKAGTFNLLLDLNHRDKVNSHSFVKMDDYTIVGFRLSQAWAENQYLYFCIKTSLPIKDIKYYSADDKLLGPDTQDDALKFVLDFGPQAHKNLEVKVGISGVSTFGALNNLKAEVDKLDYETVKTKAIETWDKALSKIDIKADNPEQRSIFYTALYHTMLQPNIYSDVDGRYRGRDLQVHNSEHDYYTVFSLWDTYRAAHPLYNLIEPERNLNFIKTMLLQYQQGGTLPVWELSSNETGCMIGYHSVPVIVDAYIKGIKGFDEKLALEAMMHSSNLDHLGLASYKAHGFIPVEEESESVSKTLEYAYDDWCIAKFAAQTGLSPAAYEAYSIRSESWKNLFDPQSQFFRARMHNKFFEPFDPFEVNFNYTEANAWQYRFYVPQDIETLVDYHGGKIGFEFNLDELFTADQATTGRNQADITGLIGQYAHGNEPSHHMAYLYNYTTAPHKSQLFLTKIMEEQYRNAPDGLSGNEDCGQMSAWYIFSSLGFYPVCPGSPYYEIGRPFFESASIKLPNGKILDIKALNHGPNNKYIQSITIDGERFNSTKFHHETLMAGGTISFTMGPEPSEWGVKDFESPLNQAKITAIPFIAKGDLGFVNQTTVSLGHVSKRAKIFYSLNGAVFKQYKTPFVINQNTELAIYAELDGMKSNTYISQFRAIDGSINIDIQAQYANQYAGIGQRTLIDGLKGTKDFRTGAWQGFFNQDVSLVVDLGQTKNLKSLSVGALHDQKSWIFLPRSVDFYQSMDGVNFSLIGTVSHDKDVNSNEALLYDFKLEQAINARYIKLVARNAGPLPAWHIGHGPEGFTWIFLDEIDFK
jgi:predicted alpha-1,2-mannosidase